ncbi:unnamed protein product [Prorocentrum cordatum]|uniref:Uncharacterized protein n=1 Tax=Prorocentrum cordatum TaxID=2364126 RepID=A0ABN9V9G2_9DINO|nr:unnamed protein product [Polarella glacialis]
MPRLATTPPLPGTGCRARYGRYVPASSVALAAAARAPGATAGHGLAPGSSQADGPLAPEGRRAAGVDGPPEVLKQPKQPKQVAPKRDSRALWRLARTGVEVAAPSPSSRLSAAVHDAHAT